MKTTDPRDSLDQKIDELLASQPIKAPTDFSARLLTEIEAMPPRKKPGRIAPLIRFALPMAAALALAFVALSQFHQGSPDSPTQQEVRAGTTSQAEILAATNNDSEALNSYEIQELLMLQEGLSGFAQIESDELNSSDLLDTLDTLYSI